VCLEVPRVGYARDTYRKVFDSATAYAVGAMDKLAIFRATIPCTLHLFLIFGAPTPTKMRATNRDRSELELYRNAETSLSLRRIPLTP
jgi:hypothetical protein